MECFIYKGLMGFFGVIVMIFDGVKSGEMLDFSGFYRSGYRSDLVGLLEKWIFKVGLWMEQICRSWLPAAALKM